MTTCPYHLLYLYIKNLFFLCLLESLFFLLFFPCRDILGSGSWMPRLISIVSVFLPWGYAWDYPSFVFRFSSLVHELLIVFNANWIVFMNLLGISILLFSFYSSIQPIRTCFSWGCLLPRFLHSCCIFRRLDIFQFSVAFSLLTSHSKVDHMTQAKNVLKINA